MKKSQVVAAIALAFALGVVAPVVSTVSAFTAADAENSVAGSATRADVQTAIAAVSAKYPVYGNMVALSELLTSKDTATAKNIKLNTNLRSVLEALVAINSDLAKDQTEILGDSDSSFADRVATALELVSKIKNYDAVAAIVNAIADKDDVAFRDAIPAINTAYKTQLLHNSDITISGYADTVKGAIADYDKYETLVGAVNTATENRALYVNVLAALESAYKAQGVMTTKGLNNLVDELEKLNPSVSDIVDLASTADNMNNYTGWATTVHGAVKAAATTTAYDSEANYDKITAIAYALLQVVPILDKTMPEIAAELVSYVAPEAGEGEGAGDNEDPSVKPGQQGILTTAEGTAAASAGIMAAVATALTAAGVGVVAFRNARRK